MERSHRGGGETGLHEAGQRFRRQQGKTWVLIKITTKGVLSSG